MHFNYLLWAAEHPERADKSAMGTINRPLLFVFRGLFYFTRFATLASLSMSARPRL
jgi:hypothetical protein